MTTPDRPSDSVVPTTPPTEVFDLALRHVGDGVVVIGRDWRFVYLNPRAEELLGRPAAELVGRDYHELFPEVVGTRFHDAYRRAMERRETVVLEDRYEPWGRWFENRIYPGPHGITILFTDVTERKRGEGALLERERQLGEILQAIDVATWSWDFVRERISARGILTALGGQGAGPVEMSGDEWFAGVHADDRAEVRRRLYALRDQGVPYEAVFRYRHAAGHDVWVHASGRALRDDAGRVVEAVGAVRDVSTERRVTEALLESEADLRLATDAAGLVVWSWDLGADAVRRSGSLLRHLGYAAADLPGAVPGQVAWWYERIHPDDRQARRALEAQLRAGTVDAADGEYRFRRADGSWATLHSRIRLQKDTAGRGVRALGVDIDVSALRENEARFRQVVESIDQIFWLTEAETGRPLYVSPAFERIWELPIEGVYRDTGLLFERIHPDDRAIGEWFLAALRTDQPTEHTIRIVRPGGEVRWLATRSFPVRDADGRVVRAAGVTTDVTERVVAEQALRASEDRLQQVQRMEAIGRLAGGVAHDFNNLLTAISISLELARDTLREGAPGGPAASVEAELEEATRAAARAADLTRQLLAFGRRQVLRPQSLDVNGVVRHVERMLQRLLPDDVLLDLALDESPWPVNADPGQLEQVLMNLVLNARDAMPAGGALTVTTARVPGADAAALGLPDGDWVRLTVADTGHGMDAATLAHVFEPFFTTKAHGRGTGLGLATVHGIVTQSGGQVRAESVPGAGSAFHVYLPRAAAAADEAGAAAAAARVPAEAPRECILVVEDERAVREAARRMLTRRGYRVLEARHGADGLMVWRERRGTIDAVVTDVRMPEMDGLAMAAALWRDAPDLPIVFMSGYAAGSLSEGQSIPEGAPFVEKPFVGETLLAAVQEALGRRG